MSPDYDIRRDDCGNVLSPHEILASNGDRARYIPGRQIKDAFRAVNITKHILQEENDSLRSVNANLLAALEGILDCGYCGGCCNGHLIKAEAAIKRAKEVTP